MYLVARQHYYLYTYFEIYDAMCELINSAFSLKK